MRRYDDSSDSGTSDDVAVSIAKVRAAILASDVRAASKPRTNYASRSAQNKTYKPTGVVASNFTYSGPNARSAGTPFGQAKSVSSMRANEFRAGERGQGVMKATSSNFKYSAPTASKPKAKAKSSSTSFKKGGVAGVLKSPEAKKFRETFKKKGLLPALRGK
jgi:hypothetical protein